MYIHRLFDFVVCDAMEYGDHPLQVKRSRPNQTLRHLSLIYTKHYDTFAIPLFDFVRVRLLFRFNPDSRENIRASSRAGLYEAKNAEISRNLP